MELCMIAADLDTIARQAAEHWGERLSSRADREAYLLGMLDELFPVALKKVVEQQLDGAIISASRGLVDEWVSKSVAAMKVPPKFNGQFDKAVTDAIKGTTSLLVRRKMVTAFRMCANGSSDSEIAAKLKTTDDGARKLVRAARARVHELQAELDAYSK
jgi:hypothetical protein